MAADTEVVRISYKELQEIATIKEERESEERQLAAKEEARKKNAEEKRKKEEEKRRKRPTKGIYQPPHRNKQDGDQSTSDKDGASIGKSDTDVGGTSEENWEEDLMSPTEPSSKEGSVEKELQTGMQDVHISDTHHKTSRKSEEMKRRSKKPEIQRYVPKGRLLEKQQDSSRDGSTDWEGDVSSPSPGLVQSPSPGAGALPLSPSPRKIDHNLQVTVVNDKASDVVPTRPSPEKSAASISSSVKQADNIGVAKGRGQGQSYSRGRGQRLNQRSNQQNEGRGNSTGLGHRSSSREADIQPTHTNQAGDNHKQADSGDSEVNKSNSKEQKEKDVKTDNTELYIVPSRPSTIGQEADRKDTLPVGTDKNSHNTHHEQRAQVHYTRAGSAPLGDKQEILNRFKRSPNKTKSRSVDKLNKNERWDEEDGYYADPENLGTMVFERSHSSEQLNLSGKAGSKPPMHRSTSGSLKAGGQARKYGVGGMRKRTDSFSSDISAGTGSDWSTEELDFEKDIDNNSKIDWNADVERELALQLASQVQDETQKMNEWFERQELGLSQKDSLHQNRSNNAMTTSIPGYKSGFLSNTVDMSAEKCNTLPFTRRKHTMSEEPRGRQSDRRRGSLGFRSRDSSVSSVQSVQSVQSAYSGDGRRRRRRRRKSSSGSQKMHPSPRGTGSMEHINIQVTCGGQGSRREVKMDDYNRTDGRNFHRQLSSEGQNQARPGSGKPDTWRVGGRGHRGDESVRDSKGQYRANSRGRGYDKRGSNERLDEPYYTKGRGYDKRGSNERLDETYYTKGRGYDKRGSSEHLDEPYYSKDRYGRDERSQQQRHSVDRQRHDSGNKGGGAPGGPHAQAGRGRKDRLHMDNREEAHRPHRGKEGQYDRGGQGQDRREGGEEHHHGNRDRHTERYAGRGRGRHDRGENKYGSDSKNKDDHVTHRGGVLHLPQQQGAGSNSDHTQQQQQQHKSAPPSQHNNWGREHTPDNMQAGRVGDRERKNSGSSQRQKTLFDPNNPSKPIVIEATKPKMEFKETDDFSSSPQSPHGQYPGTGQPASGGGPTPPPDMYNRGGPGFPHPAQFYPPGYGYGYNIRPPGPPHPGMMFPSPPGMYYGYQGNAGPPNFPGGEEVFDAYNQGMEGNQAAGSGRRKSQNQVMAEHMLREAVPLDKQLNSLISRRISGEETLHAINHLRRELLVRCERILLLDPDMANERNVEQMLWKSVFYQMVELIRKQLAEDDLEDTRLSLHKILDEGTGFYESLLQKLQKTFNFELELFLDPNMLAPENLSRHIKLALLSVQRTLICLGDIARYKEQNNNGAKVNYAKARNWYTKAQQIAPKNGRPYNQLAILAFYTKHKLDAVYFYMRSLAASNPFITARESLMSLFNEARKKLIRLMAEVTEKKRFEERKKQESLRQHKNIQQHRVEIWVKADGSSSKAKVDDNYDEDLTKLDTIQLNKRFVLSYLNVHGKLFTKIGMEMFPDSCGQMLQEFQVLLKDNAIGPQRLLQLMAINMFAIENTALKDESLESTCKSLLQQHSVQMGLDMFGILIERCAQLLHVHIKSADYPGRMFSRELEELIPGVKVWTDWMICHTDLWNPPPQVRDPSIGPQVDVWSCTADLYNILMDMDTTDIVKFYTERQDGLEVVILPEDTMMSGFVPLLGKATINTFVDSEIDRDMAKDCLRVEKLRVFGAYLYGMERPMLAYSGKTRKYYSIAPSDGYEKLQSGSTVPDPQLDDADIVIEYEEIVHLEEVADDDHVHQLKARREALNKKIEEKRKAQESREQILENNRHHCLEIEICPVFLIPDTNCFIDHLPSMKKLVSEKHYTIVIPLVVINELDGLAQGNRRPHFENEDHARKVKSRAQHTIQYLEAEFEEKNSRLKALTSKGTVMETISFRSEETSPAGNNDDLILSCCTYYCKDKARDYMPKDKDTPLRLMRDVVLLTDDRNLRLKAHTHNVPVKDIPAFMKWTTQAT